MGNPKYQPNQPGGLYFSFGTKKKTQPRTDHAGRMQLMVIQEVIFPVSFL
jgi:hypothetical protein